MAAEDYVSAAVRRGRLLEREKNMARNVSIEITGLAEATEALRQMRDAAFRAAESVRALREVPLSDLDDAIDTVAEHLEALS